MKYFLIALLLCIIIIYTIVDRLLFLYNDSFNNNKTTDTNVIITYDNNNDKYNHIPIKNNYNQKENLADYKNKDEDILIKYSSIKNKLDTNEDYAKLYDYINNIRDSIYISILDNIIYDESQLLEIIINDIEKTKLKYNFKKLKNIYVIRKKNNDITKLILFYDGLIYNTKKFKFIKNNFMGNTIVYKLNTNNKIINRYLQ